MSALCTRSRYRQVNNCYTECDICHRKLLKHRQEIAYSRAQARVFCPISNNQPDKPLMNSSQWRFERLSSGSVKRNKKTCTAIATMQGGKQ